MLRVLPHSGAGFFFIEALAFAHNIFNGVELDTGGFKPVYNVRGYSLLSVDMQNCLYFVELSLLTLVLAEQGLVFFMDEGLVAAREDIRENLLCLTQKGKIALAEEAAQVNRKAKHRRDKSNVTKEAKPVNKPVKAEENIAEEKGKRAHDYAVAVAPVVVTQVLEHWRNLVDLVQKIIRALCG